MLVRSSRAVRHVKRPSRVCTLKYIWKRQFYYWSLDYWLIWHVGRMIMIKTVLIGVLLALGARVVQEYRRAVHRDYVVHEHYPGKCRIVSGIDNGSEDVVLVPGTSLALITNGLRLVRDPSKPGGNIYLFDFAKPESGARRLQLVNYTSDAPFFMPHGLKVWPNLPRPQAPSAAGGQPPGAIFHVYIVNHHQNDTKDHVDKFEFNTAQPTQLTFVKSFTDSHFHGVVNSVAVVGDDQFYFTNFLPYFLTPIIGSLPPLETLITAPLGTVGYYDGVGGRIVKRGHVAPNGIAVSNDLSTVYVVDSHNGYLYTYARGALQNTAGANNNVGSENRYGSELSLLAQNYTAYGILDNIFIDDNGDLLIGTSPFGHGMWKFVPGLFDKRRLESAVLKVHVDQKSKIPVSTRELFNDNAKLLDGGSCAGTYGNGKAMLVGSVADKLVYCECSVGC